VVAALDSNVCGATVKTYRSALRTQLKPKFDKTSGNEHCTATYIDLFTTVVPLRLDKHQAGDPLRALQVLLQGFSQEHHRTGGAVFLFFGAMGWIDP
jgi:hypothetical protein